MSITTLSSRELNQDVTRAKKAARNGPVFITDRGSDATLPPRVTLETKPADFS